LTVDTVLIFTTDSVGFFIVIVSVVCALVDANFTAYAPLFVTFNKIFRYYVSFQCISPPTKTSRAFGL
jgi:hypothetical protein